MAARSRSNSDGHGGARTGCRTGSRKSRLLVKFDRLGESLRAHGGELGRLRRCAVRRAVVQQAVNGQRCSILQSGARRRHKRGCGTGSERQPLRGRGGGQSEWNLLRQDRAVSSVATGRPWVRDSALTDAAGGRLRAITLTLSQADELGLAGVVACADRVGAIILY